jgi:hypothetical protein
MPAGFGETAAAPHMAERLLFFAFCAPAAVVWFAAPIAVDACCLLLTRLRHSISVHEAWLQRLQVPPASKMCQNEQFDLVQNTITGQAMDCISASDNKRHGKVDLEHKQTLQCKPLDIVQRTNQQKGFSR